MKATEIRKSFSEELSWPDERLIKWAAGIIGVPKKAPADSFVLHAPLELMARAALLPLAPASTRDAARERVVWLVASYLEAGESVPAPLPVSHSSAEAASTDLLKAISASELDAVDSHSEWLAENIPAQEVMELLARSISPSLAAAAHGSIALHMALRSPMLAGSALRGASREVGRYPDWQINNLGLARGDRPLVDALLETPLLGMPGSDFIFPMVEHGKEAANHLLADVSSEPVACARALSRVAAWSMLQDTDEHAPYGWTHTLTIPQSVMRLGLEPKVAVSIAGAQVVGFRASMGTVPLDPRSPVPTVEPGAISDLVTRALLHHDAHLVKYTLACLDAAALDPEMSNLYMAASLHLGRWWDIHEDDGFFEDEY